ANNWGCDMGKISEMEAPEAALQAGVLANQPAATQEGSRMTMIQALRSAMDIMLERDPNVVIFGQDVGYFGVSFDAQKGCRPSMGVLVCSMRPFRKAVLSARRWAWALTACAQSWRYS